MRGEAEFHFAHLSLYGFAEPARFAQAVCRARYSRVTLWCHGNRGWSFSIVLHRENTVPSPPPLSLSLSFLPRRRIVGRERSAVLPVEYKCVYDPHDSHPEIQTYLLRTAASPIIMRHEFNLSGPIVNTVRLDSRPGPIRAFRNRRDVSGTKEYWVYLCWRNRSVDSLYLFICLFIYSFVERNVFNVYYKWNVRYTLLWIWKIWVR